MNTLDGLPISDHYKNLTAKGTEQHAWAILQEFFDYFDDDTPREHLWFMLTAALQYDGEEIKTRHRADMLFFYEYCTALFKAAKLLHTRQQQATKKKKK